MPFQNKNKPKILFPKFFLESLYQNLNKRELVHPDPLEFLYRYAHVKDREIAGLIASSLAYGKVPQILKSVSAILDKMPSPHDFLTKTGSGKLFFLFKNFRHRFTTGDEIAGLLLSAKSAISEYGSLENCFKSGMKNNDTDILPALELFTRKLSTGLKKHSGYLVPLPSKGSACKRMNLYLRWMVRCDQIDPGCWSGIPTSKLLVPLDIHMWKICRAAGFTSRKQPDLKTVIEITSAFKKISPDDPVKYDFALTRFGIRNEMNLLFESIAELKTRR